MDMVRNLAAASSIASGIPSSARQIAHHRRQGVGVDRRDPCAPRPPGPAAAGRRARTRSRRGRRPFAGSASGSTSHSASPVMPSGSLLVARIRSRRHSPSTRSANAAADSITCSQLSRISSASRSRTAAMSRSIGSALGARAEQSVPQAERGERGLRHVTVARRWRRARPATPRPAGRRAACARSPWPAWSCPEPPGPIKVVSRCSATSSRTAATSASLPTKLVSSARRLVFRFSSRSPSSPRSSATCSADSSGEGSTPSASASASLVRSYTSQRLGVATGRGERSHQRRHEPFPQRMRGHQLGQLGDQLRSRGRGGPPHRTDPPSAAT